TFLTDRKPGWDELERLVRDARRKPERLGPDGLFRLGSLYRSAAADLAYVRRKWPQDPSHRRLEGLVGQARALVYESESRRRSLKDFFAHEYWRHIRERPLPLVAAALLLFGSGVAAGVWAHADPVAAQSLAPGQFRGALRHRSSTSLGLTPADSAALSSY